MSYPIEMDMRHLRLLQDLRTVDVASKIGVSETTVRNWEKGRTIPTLNLPQFKKLANLYEVSLDELETAMRETWKKSGVSFDD